MDWSNKKKTSIGQKTSDRKQKKAVAENIDLRALGELYSTQATTSGLNRDALDIIMQKRGLEKSVHKDNINEDHTKTQKREAVDERVMDNIRNNRTENGGAEEAKNPYAGKEQSNAQRRNEQDRIHRRENRANETRKVLKKHNVKMPTRLKNKAIEKVKDNPHAQAKKFEKAAKRRASSGLFSFSVKNNKYYQEFAKYLGKKVAKKEEKQEKSAVKKFEKSQRKKISLIKEKSGRGSTRPNKKVVKRELTAENIRIAREKASQRNK